MMPTLEGRFRGALLGLACGDAVGTTVEFCPRGSFPPVTDMRGGGPFGLLPGQWTDDTSMAMCLAESLLNRQGFDARDQMGRYLNWWKHGYWSATGRCFDIGTTTAQALRRYQDTGEPFSGSCDPRSAGNGSLMRLAPAVLFAWPDRDAVMQMAGESSRTTHGALEAIESCRAMAAVLHALLGGIDKRELPAALAYVSCAPKVQAILDGGFLDKPERDIRGTGYCIDALEAALWCFLHTGSFEAAVLRAANLGDDADTTAAIVGQLAGAHYGVEGIPAHWLQKLALREDIEEMAVALHARVAGGLRTSESSPLRLCEVSVPGLPGRFGLTICPGKRGESIFGGTWWRDLDTDLAVIRDWGAGAVLSLLEDHEFDLLGIPQFPAVMRTQPFAWHYLNIRDRDVPDARFEDAWPAVRAALRELLAQGRGVAVHCRGGIGRTGLVVARFLVEEGVPPEEAIALVRLSRPGAIETAAQEHHVRRQLALR